jgi:1-deoxy-D-xylulose-5-phosphate reductoisomerase
MALKVKRLAVLGSTGSIGRQTLDVVRTLPERFRIIGLAAGRNLDLLKKQIDEFHPDFISYSAAESSRGAKHHKASPVILTAEAIAAHADVDLVVIAISGMAGLGALMAAVSAGKTIALANKESLVAAGELITNAVKKSGTRILPVDSEHSAIFQCLNGENQPPRRIILTASGGPFRRYSLEKMAAVTPARALKHPSWNMGRKVTIDSATLMNKGLEVIEARWLFNVPIDDISVLIHPRSIIHSMVEFADGSVKAQLGCPDMRLPIQYALTYPDRVANEHLPRLDWREIKKLDFEPPDTGRFPCLNLAIEAGRAGGTFPAVLCAADEVAVTLFLDGRIGFLDIASLVQRTLEKHENIAHPGIDDIMAADAWARQTSIDLAGGGPQCG